MIRTLPSDSSNLISYTQFQNSCPDAARLVLSNLDYPDFLRFINISKNAQAFSEKENNFIERAFFSRVQIFDRAHFEKHWGAIITDQFDPYKIDIFVLREFLKIYYGPNPIGKGRVKDACLMPAVVPEKVMIDGIESIYCLNRLGELAEKPKEGYAAKYFDPNTSALIEHGEIGEKQAKLVILLRGIFARNKDWCKYSLNPAEIGQVQSLGAMNAETGYGCETEPDAVSQNTVLFAHHAVTGECPFGDESGMEGQRTYGRTRERVGTRYRLASGGFSAGRTSDSLQSSAAVLRVTVGCSNDEEDGVGVMRKFPSPCTPSTDHRPTSNRSPLKTKCKVLRSYK
jgi:hypothetical protein